MVRHLPDSCALILDSPHSGTCYPADFRFSCDALHLRRVEGTHAEKLYDFAHGVKVNWVGALFPRSYRDTNRNTTAIDESLLDAPWPDAIDTDPDVMSKVRFGKGLIWRTTDDGLPIYDRYLSVAEVQARIASYWRTYHAAVALAIDEEHAKCGYSIHINCHSMPAVASANVTDFPREAHADFVVDDRDGTSADAALTSLICAHLRSLGYNVACNHPYKGVELVRRHSNPAGQRHGVQLEINRKLYVNEATLAVTIGFAPLKKHLLSLVGLLLATDPRNL